MANKGRGWIEYKEWLGRLGIDDDYINKKLEENDNDIDEVLKIMLSDFKTEMKEFLDKHTGYNIDKVFNKMKPEIQNYIELKVIPETEQEIITDNILKDVQRKTFFIDERKKIIVSFFDKDFNKYKDKVIGRVNKVSSSKGVITRYKKNLNRLDEYQKIRLNVHIDNIRAHRPHMSIRDIKKYLEFTDKQLNEIKTAKPRAFKSHVRYTKKGLLRELKRSKGL